MEYTLYFYKNIERIIIMNIEFLVVSYFVGLFVDWIFQSDWQALNKSKWNKNDNKKKSLLAVTSHSLIYSLLTSILIFICIKISLIDFYILIVILFITHTIIDTRIPVKFIMKLKGMTNDQINDFTKYGFLHIGIDHRLHELILFILSFIIN